jgi:type VI secretion system secreted protein Hcp
MRKGQVVFQWTVALLLALTILAPVPAFAQAATGLQIFVLVDGVKGESTDDKHKDWIDAFSYGDGVSQGAANPAYTSYGAMLPDFAAIAIVKQIDAASPKLREACATGKHFKKVTIEMYENGFRFFQVTLEEVMIASVQAVMPDLTSMPALTAAASPSVWVLQEKVGFAFAKITWLYTKQKRPDGSGGGNVTGGYDFKARAAR